MSVYEPVYLQNGVIIPRVIFVTKDEVNVWKVLIIIFDTIAQNTITTTIVTWRVFIVRYF